MYMRELREVGNSLCVHFIALQLLEQAIACGY